MLSFLDTWTATWAPWITLGVVAAVLVAMFATRYRPHLILIAAATVLLTLGIIDEGVVLASVANPGVGTIAALFAVVAGLRETGAMGWLASGLLGRPQRLWSAQLRLLFPVALLSAFMNNIPLVAMMMPVVADWSKKIRISPSRLLIPVSYAAILGGSCTLVGTSTTLVVDGLLRSTFGQEGGLGMFDLAYVGVPCALVGIAYLVFTSKWLLKERTSVFSSDDDTRQYTVEMVVEPGSALEGKSVEAAGLRHLPGAYLVRIERDRETLLAVDPQTLLVGSDRLIFAGVLETVVDLQRLRGLSPVPEERKKLTDPTTRRALIEVVVSNSCPLVGRSIRDGRFRSRYNAVVIAVARNGHRLYQKIGDIELAPGDTLLVEARSDFAIRHKNSRDFYLVSRLEGAGPARHERALVALLILATMVAMVSLGWLSMFHAGVLAAGGMVLSRCCTADEAVGSLDLPVLLAIVASLCMGHALSTSGAAALVVDALFRFDSPRGALAMFCGLAFLLTNLVNSNAAAVILFPIGIEAANRLGASFTPFAIALILGASLSFATPIGYQTHLMVMGPGGYRASDFLRIGAPLTVLLWGLIVLLIPMFWSF